MIIIHSVKEAFWNGYRDKPYYGEDSLEQFGFIHCSEVSTYQWVAPNFKEETDPYVLLVIDTDLLQSPLIWEDLRNCGMFYPHIYGLLNTDAVIAVLPHLWSKDKEWVKNPELLAYEASEGLKLIYPHPRYLSSYREANRESRENGVPANSFYDPQKEDIFATFENYRLGIGLPEGYVKTTFFWLVDRDRFIGGISVRHALTPSLLRYGGHIGYAVRFSEWGKGYGTQMLRLVLPHAKAITKDNRFLITCDDDNIGSARVIEKNGGILENKVQNIIDGKEITTRRYWITL